MGRQPAWTTRTVASITFDLMARLDLALVGQRIREARRGLDLTQDDLAEIVGVHKRTIENWERGQTKPFDRIDDLAEGLGVSIVWLLHGIDPSTPPAEGGRTQILEQGRENAERIDAMAEAVAQLREDISAVLRLLEDPGTRESDRRSEIG